MHWRERSNLLTMGPCIQEEETMADIISLNCLVIPRTSFESISDRDVITLCH